MESGNLHPWWVVTVVVLRVGLVGGRTYAQGLGEEAFHHNHHLVNPFLVDLLCPEGHGRVGSGGHHVLLGHPGGTL